MAAGKPAARVQVRGAAEFRKAMKGMGADLKDLTAANKEAAKTVLEAAKENSPALSGQLRDERTRKGYAYQRSCHVRRFHRSVRGRHSFWVAGAWH
jgi:hypothetical protein